MPTIQIRTPDGFTPACTAKLNVDRSPRRSSVVLPAGARLKIDPEDRQSNPKSNFEQARMWIADGIVQVLRQPQGDGAHLTLTEDHACSLSAAAVLVRGKSGSGWEWWAIDEPDHQFNGQKISKLLPEGDRRQDANAGEAGKPPNVGGLGGQNLPMPFAALVDPNNSQLHSTSQSEFYNGVVDAFKGVKGVKGVEGVEGFKRINGDDAWTAGNWPETPGVYAVWRTSENKVAELLYVGMTGKVKNDGTMQGGCLRDRLGRWDPYCFQQDGPYEKYFEYGPNASGDAVLNLKYPVRYKYHIPAKEIRVDCFLIEKGVERRMAPALFEALLLQHHLAIRGCLPPANNAF
jgi:hypothetical protein